MLLGLVAFSKNSSGNWSSCPITKLLFTSHPIMARLAAQTKNYWLLSRPLSHLWSGFLCAAQRTTPANTWYASSTLLPCSPVKLLPPFAKLALTINNVALHFKGHCACRLNRSAPADLFLIFMRSQDTLKLLTDALSSDALYSDAPVRLAIRIAYLWPVAACG